MRSQRFHNFIKNMATGGIGNPRFMNRVTEAGGNSADGLQGRVRNEGADCVELEFHDYIGDSWTGSDSGTIVKLLKENRGKRIECDINSFGGSAYDGIAIYNAFITHDAPVNITISGIAYSAASIIAMGGDTIKIVENGTLGIHPASIGVWGNQYDLDHMCDWLKSIDLGIIETYAARTGKPIKQITEWFIGKNNDGSFFNGKQACENGFCDECLPLKKKGDSKTDEDTEDSENSSSQVPAAVKERLKQINDQMQAIAVAERRKRLQSILSSN